MSEDKKKKKRANKYEKKIVLKPGVSFDDLVSASVGKPPKGIIKPKK